MKYLITISILLFTLNNINSQNNSIEFRNGDISDLINEAKKSDKLIFVDMTATWCKPCKKMEKTTFIDSSVVTLFSNNFLSKKIYIDKDSTYLDTMSAKLKSKTSGVPHFYFMDTNGNTILTESGFRTPKGFLQMSKKAIASKGISDKLALMEKNYSGMKNDMLFLKEYMELLRQVGDRSKSALDDYLQLIPETDYLKEKIIYTIIRNENSIEGKGYEIITSPNNKRKLFELIGIYQKKGENSYNTRIALDIYEATLKIIENCVIDAIDSGNRELLDKCRAEFIRIYQNKEKAKKISERFLEMFENKVKP
jgi:thioredoxin-related protein